LQSGLRAGRMRALDDAQKEAEMKRFHVHVGVEDLERSILFCSGLFGAEPKGAQARLRQVVAVNTPAQPTKGAW
jgi:hypothetical protein